MLDLKQIEIATDEDISYQIHYWAKLFKAVTWEEIRMLVKNNEALRQAAETAYELSADEQIRLQCQAREDYYRDQRYMQGRLEKAERELKKKDAELQKKDTELQKKDTELQKKDTELQKKEAELLEKELRNRELRREIEQLKAQAH